MSLVALNRANIKNLFSFNPKKAGDGGNFIERDQFGYAFYKDSFKFIRTTSIYG